MGGKHFTIPCTLSRNGYGVRSSALVDTGANGFAFINRSFATELSKFLSIKPVRIPNSLSIQGYDGKQATTVSHALILHLTIDTRRQTSLPFYILDLGTHDIILGLRWMEYFNIWLNPRQKRLIWPEKEDKIAPPSLHREIIAERQAISSRDIHATHQRDVYARDTALKHEDIRRQAGRQIKALTLRTYAQDLNDGLRKMEQELRGVTKHPTQSRTRRTTSQNNLLTIDIAQISATGFHFNLYRPENEIFQTSLYEIDRILEERAELNDPQTGSNLKTTETDEQELLRLLPAYLRNYSDVFSKAASERPQDSTRSRKRHRLSSAVPTKYGGTSRNEAVPSGKPR